MRLSTAFFLMALLPFSVMAEDGESDLWLEISKVRAAHGGNVFVYPADPALINTLNDAGCSNTARVVIDSSLSGYEAMTSAVLAAHFSGGQILFALHSSGCLSNSPRLRYIDVRP